jgi:hypothetical protein
MMCGAIVLRPRRRQRNLPLLDADLAPFEPTDLVPTLPG